MLAHEHMSKTNKPRRLCESLHAEKSEVGDNNTISILDKDILRAQIFMDYFLRMQIRHTLKRIP